MSATACWGRKRLTKYKIWQAPIFAFFSTQFYRELGINGKGAGFVYMFLLLVISSAIPALKGFASAQQILLNHNAQIANQFPEIRIENGKLSINKESPSFVSNPETGDYIIAFDTSGQNLVSPELNVPLLVTADSVTSVGGQPTSFKGINNVHLTPQGLMHWAKVLSFAIPAGYYVYQVASQWLQNIVMAFAFSLAGLLLARTVAVNIKYEGILRITSYALGNVIILDGIVNIFPITVPGGGVMEFALPSWFLYKFILGLGYTLFGVGANLSPPGFQSVSDSNDEQSSA